MEHPKQATFYFDFISPYAYLLWHRLQNLSPEQSNRLEFRYRPVLFAGLLDHWGQKGPAEIEAKRIHTYRQTYSMASQFSIPFKMPDAHPFNPLSALRLALAAGNTPEAIDSVFRSIWVDGHRPDSPAGFSAIVSALDFEGGETAAREAITYPDIKAQLQENGAAALEDKVFGVPTIIVDGELFWGFDSFDALFYFLDHPDCFRTEEMLRMNTVLPSASRSL
ncbi:MAG: 2-hydroxychromene-2-carboxylate isomerase [Halioglobus sp.]|jgi:2-hydroxychromene-2-carboxylate isomerase